MKKSSGLLLIGIVVVAVLFFGSSNIIDLSTASVRAEATVSAAQLGIKLNDARGVIAPTLVALEQAQSEADIALVQSQAELYRAQANKTNGENSVQWLCLFVPVVVAGLAALFFAWRWIQDDPHPTPHAPRPPADPRGDK